MKIAVYTIAKNEEYFSERWSKCSLDADGRFVLDTGSTDNTINILQENGVNVSRQIINPWRFDEARNLSLDLIPTDFDICISLDMDEILCTDWRQYLEKDWTNETTMLRYPFFCKPRSAFGFKVHSRNTYKWKYAVHEILIPKKHHFESWSNDFTIFHLPKENGGSYLKMLEFWNEKEPEELHYIFYIAREYFDLQQYEKSLKYLYEFVNSKLPKDPNEESFAHRMISWCLKYTKSNYNDVIKHLFISVGISPNSKEVWGHIAEEMLSIRNFSNAFSASINAIKIKDQTNSYFIEDHWNEKMYNILNQSANFLGISQNKIKEIIEN